MNNLLILYGADISSHALEPVFDGKSALELSIEQAKKFSGVKKTVLFVSADLSVKDLAAEITNDVTIEKRESWDKHSILVRIAELQADFDLIYFAYADCPFLDPVLAGKIAERHKNYAAEYSYADGWPYGLAPETISPGTPGILANILSSSIKNKSEYKSEHAERDLLFSVIQKDINSFDIEAEISSVDLRCHRLNLCADSKRNLLLLKNFYSAANGIPDTEKTESIIANQPNILRTLPNFIPIQVYGGCPQKCAICPYPSYTDSQGRSDFMDTSKFTALLDKIIEFCGDAVIDLSLWGEISLHPDKLKLIEAVLSRPQLSLIIETTGIGWKTEELEKCAAFLKTSGSNAEAPNSRLSWIVSLDTNDPQRYSSLHGAGFAEAQQCAKQLLSLFPNDCYVQAVRINDEEQDTENFYRYWKENSPNGEKNIIIQKYDDFCGALEKKQASDISPVIRQSCWHIMRDLPILIDGTVPLCREDLSVLKGEKTKVLGNVFTDSLEAIWQNGVKYYAEHCNKKFNCICADCDEYYTYNF
ncbi:MAG: spiro-SPASM protein [Treponema sp.]|nr:spiro-SPASM protein [Treponema sp.]